MYNNGQAGPLSSIGISSSLIIYGFKQLEVLLLILLKVSYLFIKIYIARYISS